MWTAVGICAVMSEAVSLASTAVSLGFAPKLVAIFIREPLTIRFGAEFLRILCLAIPIYSLTVIIIAVFQAMGRAEEPFLLSILHKGTVDIALLFLIRNLAGPERLPWATLISEALALLAGIWMLARNKRKLKA